MEIENMSAEEIITHAIVEENELYVYLCESHTEAKLLALDVTDKEIRKTTLEWIMEAPEF